MSQEQHTNLRDSFMREYKDLIEEYREGGASGERVGEAIVNMAQYYAMANQQYAQALTAFNKISGSIEKTTDDAGKPISSVKAKTLAAETEESDNYILAKTNLDSIEQMINALKSLQKGILNEYNHSANT